MAPNNLRGTTEILTITAELHSRIVDDTPPARRRAATPTNYGLCDLMVAGATSCDWYFSLLCNCKTRASEGLLDTGRERGGITKADPLDRGWDLGEHVCDLGEHNGPTLAITMG